MNDKDLLALKRQYKRARVAYYNRAPIMSDAAFNKMEDRIEKLDPTWSELHKTGVRISNKKTERPLFEFMPSLNKRYPDAWHTHLASKAVVYITRWAILDKLDGTSLQLRYKNLVPSELITRGDGINGGDVSFLLPALIAAKRIPAKLPKGAPDVVVLRLEGIMRKDVFAKHWSREVKGKHGFDNIRNGVNGIFNNSEPHPALASVDMVVLGVYGMELQAGLEQATAWGFNVVRACFLKHAPDAAEMIALLAKRRKESPYEMDGLVAAPSRFPYKYLNADKPKGIVAFKINDESNAFEVTVLEIIWQKTRLRRWMPKIRIKPVKIDGVMVTHATLHNAAWMTERGIGVGAVLKVLRSGGVIPKVVGVVKKAKAPSVPPGEYELKGRHFVMTEHDATSIVRGIHHFMTTLGIEFLAQKTIAKLYDASYGGTARGFRSVSDYLWHVERARDNWDATHTALTRCELGPKQSEKILNELCRVLHKKVPLIKLMDASGCFEGTLGERRLQQLVDQGIQLKDVLNWKAADWDRLDPKSLHGFQTKSLAALRAGVTAFKPWLREVLQYISVNANQKATAQPQAVDGPLKGINVAWTSYRSQEQEALVARLGGIAQDKFNAKTTVLLYDPNGKASTKVDKAGERAMTWAQFVRKYKISKLTGYEEAA